MNQYPVQAPGYPAQPQPGQQYPGQPYGQQQYPGQPGQPGQPGAPVVGQQYPGQQPQTVAPPQLNLAQVAAADLGKQLQHHGVGGVGGGILNTAIQTGTLGAQNLLE